MKNKKNKKFGFFRVIRKASDLISLYEEVANFIGIFAKFKTKIRLMIQHAPELQELEDSIERITKTIHSIKE